MSDEFQQIIEETDAVVNELVSSYWKEVAKIEANAIQGLRSEEHKLDVNQVLQTLLQLKNDLLKKITEEYEHCRDKIKAKIKSRKESFMRSLLEIERLLATEMDNSEEEASSKQVTDHSDRMRRLQKKRQEWNQITTRILESVENRLESISIRDN